MMMAITSRSASVEKTYLMLGMSPAQCADFCCLPSARADVISMIEGSSYGEQEEVIAWTVLRDSDPIGDDWEVLCGLELVDGRWRMSRRQHGVELVQTELRDGWSSNMRREAIAHIEALEGEVTRLRAALEIIAGDSNDASWSAELAHKTLKALEGSE